MTPGDKQVFEDDDALSRHTIDNAVADGVLFDLRKMRDNWSDLPISHATMHLLEQGYLVSGDVLAVNYPCLRI